RDRLALWPRREQRGALAGDQPHAVGPHIGDAGAAIRRVLARPLDRPVAVERRRDERIRNRRPLQIRSEVDDEQAVIGVTGPERSRGVVGEESQREGGIGQHGAVDRSEERRVGKECRYRWSPNEENKKKEEMSKATGLTGE